jgi:hypothetical protein
MKTEKTCSEPSINRPRLYLRILLNYFFSVFTLVLLLMFFPQLGNLEHLYSTIWLLLILAAVQIVIWPLFLYSFLSLLNKVSSTFMLLFFPLLSLFVPAVLLMLSTWLSPGIQITDKIIGADTVYNVFKRWTARVQVP